MSTISLKQLKEFFGAKSPVYVTAKAIDSLSVSTNAGGVFPKSDSIESEEFRQTVMDPLFPKKAIKLTASKVPADIALSALLGSTQPKQTRDGYIRIKVPQELTAASCERVRHVTEPKSSFAGTKWAEMAEVVIGQQERKDRVEMKTIQRLLVESPMFYNRYAQVIGDGMYQRFFQEEDVNIKSPPTKSTTTLLEGEGLKIAVHVENTLKLDGSVAAHTIGLELRTRPNAIVTIERDSAASAGQKDAHQVKLGGRDYYLRTVQLHRADGEGRLNLPYSAIPGAVKIDVIDGKSFEPIYRTHLYPEGFPTFTYRRSWTVKDVE